jgi:GC-rich sequence DNA-binding factor
MDEEGDETELGPDGDLVSAMISTAVIPRLCKMIEGGTFNPYSSKDLRRVLDLVEEVEAHVDKSQAKFQVSSYGWC